MEIYIENEHLRASFSAKGAELQHLCGVDSGTEYLWRGDPAYWPKFSPVLFPIVGAIRDNQYRYQGKVYTLPRHGFARDMVFEVTKPNDLELLFTLRHSEQTLKVYPFPFTLSIRYQLSAATLTCCYEVSNPADNVLWFSIGGHPAFAAPLNNEGRYSDYFLTFDADDILTFYPIQDNFLSDETSTLVLQDKKLFLKHELFYKDALVFKDLKSRSISLMNNRNYNGINFKFDNFPYFGIWAARDADFVCLEPWCGIADTQEPYQDLSEKEGMNCLASGEVWTRSWQITCF